MLVKFIILIVIFKIASGNELNKVVDLTWDFSNETIYWVEHTGFHYTKVIADSTRNFWYASNEFCASEHGGTHFDAPYHFYKDGWKVADVPISRLLTQGAFIDLSQSQPTNLLPKHLEDWVRVNGDFQNNTVLLIKFGRSKLWQNHDEYLGLDKNGNLNFPALSVEAANWIAKNGKIIGVGLDTASVDPGDSSDFSAHRVLSKNMIYNLENVKLVEDLPAKGFNLIVLPMKLKYGTGAPVRVLAVPKNLQI